MGQASRTISSRSLEEVLIDRLRSPVETDRDVTGVIALDVEDGEGWTLYVERTVLRLAQDVVQDADTTISADMATMTAVLDGSVSGVDAFVEGNLRVSGNLALSLRPNGSFPQEGRRNRMRSSGIRSRESARLGAAI